MINYRYLKNKTDQKNANSKPMIEIKPMYSKSKSRPAYKTVALKDQNIVYNFVNVIHI